MVKGGGVVEVNCTLKTAYHLAKASFALMIPLRHNLIRDKIRDARWGRQLPKLLHRDIVRGQQLLSLGINILDETPDKLAHRVDGVGETMEILRNRV